MYLDTVTLASTGSLGWEHVMLTGALIVLL